MGDRLPGRQEREPSGWLPRGVTMSAVAHVFGEKGNVDNVPMPKISLELLCLL